MLVRSVFLARPFCMAFLLPMGYSYREESQFMSSTSSSHTPMGSKKAIQNGHMEQHIIDEGKNEYNGMRGRSDSLVSDLSSIAKVRSVSKSSTNFTSSERYTTTEYHTSQQYTTTEYHTAQ